MVLSPFPVLSGSRPRWTPTSFCRRFKLTSIQEIFQSMDRNRVRYLLVGGYASVIHRVPRTTLDVDLTLDP
ncbi:MAG: hypothetical protein V3U52_08250 [Thermoplasmata archaeon]